MAAAHGVYSEEPKAPDEADYQRVEPGPGNQRQLDCFHITETEDCGETHERQSETVNKQIVPHTGHGENASSILELYVQF